VVKDVWLKEIAYTVATNKIPPGLVVNADQTGKSGGALLKFLLGIKLCTILCCFSG
jgi:hypothetical protein